MEHNRHTFIAFLECELRGEWSNPVIDHAIIHGADPEDFLSVDPPNSEQFACQGDDCEIWLVRPDGLRRAWHFAKEHMVIFRGNVISFYQNSVIEELSVDENKKT